MLTEVYYQRTIIMRFSLVTLGVGVWVVCARSNNGVGMYVLHEECSRAVQVCVAPLAAHSFNQH